MTGSPIGGALKQIHHLFAEGSAAGLADGPLLERFFATGDGAAFAALVQRHGPMVLGICRSVLRNPADVEDAFQATFLVLVCKARSIRGQEALAGWLRQVAHRVAVRAGVESARRRACEQCAGHAADPQQAEPGDDWRPVLHEELARLSDRYRLPLLLCDLEGKTHAQAAAELGCGPATIQRRLTAARALLRSRLTRRGIALSAGTLAVALGRPAAAQVPPGWVEVTVRAAASLSSRAARIAVGDLISTATADLVRLSLRAMLLGKLKAVAVLTILVAVLVGAAWAVAGPRNNVAGDPAAAPQAASHSQAMPPGRPDAMKPDGPGQPVLYQGQVLDPEGRPFAGARLYLLSRAAPQWWSMSAPLLTGFDYGLKHGRVASVRATSGDDGRFRFQVPRSDFETYYAETPWDDATILAVADGYGPGLANRRGGAGEWRLQLARGDVPIVGRIIDLEARPVAGATVRVLDIGIPRDGSLDAWLKAAEERGEFHDVDDERFFGGRMGFQPDPPVIPPATTGADGTFRIEGVGRERVATLQIEGPAIETAEVKVRTRPGAMIRIPPPNPIYGATFEHVAGRSRPIEGTVRDRDTGRPLAGVMISGPRREQRISPVSGCVQAVTDAQGRYRLTGLPQGREGFILAVPPCDWPYFGLIKAELKAPRDEDLPYLRARIPVDGSHGTGPISLDISLKRGVWITGRVVDRSTGMPVRGHVEYFVFADNPHLEESPAYRSAMLAPHITGQDGTFRLVAFPGPGVLTAQAYENTYTRSVGIDGFRHPVNGGALLTYPYVAISEGYHVLAEIDPAPGTASMTRDLLLESGRSLTVAVVDPEGRPLTGNRIRGRVDFGDWEETTAAASSYTIVGLRPGKVREVAFLNQKRKLTGELVLRGDERAPQTVRLQPWGVVVGRVVDAHGEPWGEAELHGIRLPSWFPKLGKDGRFRIEGLVPGKPYELFLFANAQVQGTIARRLTVKPGETRDLGDVVPERPEN